MMKPRDKYFKRPTVLGEGVWLYNTKFAHNCGTVLRVCAGYAIPQLCVTGERVLSAVDELDRVPREERLRGYAMVDLFHHDNPLSILDADVTPVAVEFRPHSTDLFEFKHPEKAVYIFGPEDGALGREVLTRCHHFVRIDTMECLNLAVAVGIVLYDRACKAYAKKLTTSGV